MSRPPLPKGSNALVGYSKELETESRRGNLELGMARLKRAYAEGDGKLDVMSIMSCVGDDAWLKENLPDHKFKTGVGRFDQDGLIAAQLAWLKFQSDPKSITPEERASIEKFAVHAADFIVMGIRKEKPVEIVFPE